MNRKQRRASQAQFQKASGAAPQTFSSEKTNGDAFNTLAQQGVKAHQEGNLDLAREIYAQALSLDPHQPALINLLSIATFQKGLPLEAIQLIQKSIELAPQMADPYNNLGVFLGSLHRHNESLESFRKAVALDPHHLDALNNLARQSLNQRLFSEAKESLLKLIALRPQDGEAYNNLANCYYEEGDREKALSYYKKSIEASPSLADPYSNLSNLYKDWGKTQEGLEMAEKALQLRPQFPAAYNNKGALHLQKKEFEEARQSFSKAVELDPAFAVAWSNLSHSLWELRRIEEAITASEKSLTLNPNYAQGYNNLGNIYEGMGRHQDALKLYQKAFRLDPHLPEVSYNMGLVYQSLRTFDMAIVSLKKALALRPQYGDALCTLASVYGDLGMEKEAQESFQKAYDLSPDPTLKLRQALVPLILPQSEEEIDHWRQHLCQVMTQFREEGHEIQDPGRQVCVTTFFASYHARDNKEFFKFISQFYRDVTPSLRFTAPHCHTPLPLEGRKIRIAFVSNFWWEHAVGWAYRDLILNLPQDVFSITLLAIGVEGDTLTQELAARVDQVLSVASHLDDATKALCDHPQDIIIYTDIGMHPITYFLAHKRLAPIQAVTTGHPDTTGISTIDYYISAEELETEDAQKYYSEELVRLPGMYVSYRRPSPPDGPLSRAQLGVPEQGTLYMCPQSLFKIDASMDAIFAEILRKDPTGFVVLICSEQCWIQKFRARASRIMGDVMDRLYILPFQHFGNFMASLMTADVLLDPVYFNGGNTSFQGLSVGTPIVTKEGQWARNRCGIFLYRYMGIKDCIAQTDQEYVEIAVRLGTDKTWRQEIHEKILAHQERLYNSPDAAREWTRFLQTIAHKTLGSHP